MSTHVQGSLAAFVAACSAKTPTPGGGAAASLFAAVGSALGAMAARFTYGKKGAEAHGPELEAAIGEFDRLAAELLPLVDADCAAYDAVTAAYGLKKDSPEQQAVRDTAIQAALLGALETPLAGARLCARGLALAAAVAPKIHKNLASDAAVCALALHAGLEGLALNVRINAASLKDAVLAAEKRSELGALRAAGAAARDAAIGAVESRIGG